METDRVLDDSEVKENSSIRGHNYLSAPHFFFLVRCIRLIFFFFLLAVSGPCLIRVFARVCVSERGIARAEHF